MIRDHDYHWLTVDGEVYINKWKKTPFYTKSDLRSLTRRLRRRLPNAEIGHWSGTTIGVK